MLSTLSKTTVAAMTALIIGLAPIATADLAFARGMGGGGGGIHMGGGGGGHFGGGFSGGQFGGGQFGGFGGGHFAGGAFRERGFHRHFRGFDELGGYSAYCGPYGYPYPPYGPYGYTACY
jgi:hypothetical protein